MTDKTTYTVTWSYWTRSDGDQTFATFDEANQYFQQRVDDAKAEQIRLVEMTQNDSDNVEIIHSATIDE